MRETEVQWAEYSKENSVTWFHVYVFEKSSVCVSVLHLIEVTHKTEPV